ncbi:hypothetical protein CVT26_002390 [Gymnopilus dilepis]|uniref:Uncharacterized protein n=1 Tax=Gymnopilus dilepis TaxID=231916 RepID=A0A409YNC6_9AGAR|nr:hypothetical protein CVT26_002390 [Gymnopilus dilepis]
MLLSFTRFRICFHNAQYSQGLSITDNIVNHTIYFLAIVSQPPTSSLLGYLHSQRVRESIQRLILHWSEYTTVSRDKNSGYETEAVLGWVFVCNICVCRNACTPAGICLRSPGHLLSLGASTNTVPVSRFPQAGERVGGCSALVRSMLGRHCQGSNLARRFEVVLHMPSINYRLLSVSKFHYGRLCLTQGRCFYVGVFRGLLESMQSKGRQLSNLCTTDRRPILTASLSFVPSKFCNGARSCKKEKGGQSGTGRIYKDFEGLPTPPVVADDKAT